VITCEKACKNSPRNSFYIFRQKVRWGNRRQRDHWGDLGVDGSIILGWISRRWDVGIWTEYHLVQNLLSSRLLSKSLKIKIYRTVILPVVLYGCETWSLTLREERKLRVFENNVLRRIFGPRRDAVTGMEEIA